MTPQDQATSKSLSVFAALLGLCCFAHISIHLPKIALSWEWASSAVVLLAAGWVMARPCVRPLICLAIAQCINVALVAPYNPDHWLLVFFIHLLILSSSAWLRISTGQVSPSRLIQKISAPSRVVFLICYGCAAFSKYNFDFLFSPDSSALALFELQVGAMPILEWFVWRPMVPWVAIGCETIIPLLLLFRRTRGLGILVAVGFHTALIISPAIVVFDFTLTIITMMYLFTPADFDTKILSGVKQYRSRFPDLFDWIQQYKWGLLLAPIAVVLLISCWSSLLGLPPIITRIRGAVALLVTVAIGLVFLKGLLGSLFCHQGFRERPEGIVAWVVICLAVLNAACPYLGLKTEGSFTMFSDLRTEKGCWNHLVVPEACRVFTGYQDEFIMVVESNSDSVNKTYTAKSLLANQFEIQRMILNDPEIELTIENNERRIEIDKRNRDELGPPPSFLARKLMIFSPITRDGSPFLSN